ncbi:MAG: anaerobic ribonucleoside-triphosphate reductase activating protein, partial [Minisyncoccales bacterium]
MKIAGIEELSLIDFPEKISCVVFLSGCNARCPFCHNPELVLPAKIKSQPIFSERKFFSFLKERKNFLEAVV